MYDVLVVGCGLSGMTIARYLADRGKKVQILEKRNHIGGNIYDYYNKDGLLIQKYGPHVFFTDNPSVEKYINQFSPTFSFYPECRTFIDNKAIPIPFNFDSIELIYDTDKADMLIQRLIEEFGENTVVSVLEVINSKDEMIHEYGIYMFDKEYRKYTAKQWGIPIEGIDPSVFLRVPVYISRKSSYLNAKYQFLPAGGFSELARRMMSHSNISVKLGVDALEDVKLDYSTKRISVDGFSETIVYTGQVDALFDYVYGELPYRSLEFGIKKIDNKKSPETALSAFPESDKYIRITDYSKFPPQGENDYSYLSIEYPMVYRRNELCGNEPYYPILTDESKMDYTKYKELANQYDNLVLCGRLADFKYYNMDIAIERALGVGENILSGLV